MTMFHKDKKIPRIRHRVKIAQSDVYLSGRTAGPNIRQGHAMANPYSAASDRRIAAQRDDGRTVAGRLGPWRRRRILVARTFVSVLVGPAGFVHGASRLAVKLAGRDPLDPHQAAPTIGRPGHAHLVVFVPLVDDDDINHRDHFAFRTEKKEIAERGEAIKRAATVLRGVRRSTDWAKALPSSTARRWMAYSTRQGHSNNTSPQKKNLVRKSSLHEPFCVISVGTRDNFSHDNLGLDCCCFQTKVAHFRTQIRANYTYGSRNLFSFLLSL